MSHSPFVMAGILAGGAAAAWLAGHVVSRLGDVLERGVAGLFARPCGPIPSPARASLAAWLLLLPVLFLPPARQPAALFFGAGLFAVALVDLKGGHVPDILVWPLLAGGLLAGAWPDQAVAAVLAGVGFWLAGRAAGWLAGGIGLGGGDVALGAALGAWMGALPALLALALAALAGLLHGLAARPAVERPFAPFLAAAAWGLFLLR